MVSFLTEVLLLLNPPQVIVLFPTSNSPVVKNRAVKQVRLPDNVTLFGQILLIVIFLKVAILPVVNVPAALKII
jgi:hypothetical protein